MKPFIGLKCGKVSLYLIDAWNMRSVAEMMSERGGRAAMCELIEARYGPRVDEAGERTRWGFYTRFNGHIAGFSSLWIKDGIAQTGAETLPIWRGNGIASMSKPALFHLAFEILGLDRVETACAASNAASKASIEKTPGFEFSGMGSGQEGEEEFRYVITRESWAQHYKDVVVEVLR